MARADDVERRFGHHRVGQDQHVDVDEGAQFGGRIARQFRPQRLQAAVHFGDGVLQPFDFGFKLFFRHQIVLDVEGGGREQVRAALLAFLQAQQQAAEVSGQRCVDVDRLYARGTER